MTVVPFIRIAVLGVTTLFSIVVLAISAHLISQTQQYFLFTATFCALAIAVAAISLVTLPVMLVVDFLRRGAFTSMIVVELVWLYILCILWVATAGETVSEYGLFFPYGCDFVDTISNGMCRSAQVIEAFSFLNFVITLLYAGVLSVMAVVAGTRGQAVWLSSVKESFGSLAAPVQHPMTQYGNAPATPQPTAAVQVRHAGGLAQPGGTLGGPGTAV